MGYERNEVVGKLSIRDLLPPACESIFRERQELLREGLTPEALDVQFLRKDGSLIDVRITSTGIFDQEGLFIGSRTAVMNEVAQRQLERSLRTQETLNQTIIEASDNGILLYRADGQCIMANQAAARIVGASVNEVLKQNFNTIPSWQATGLVDVALKALAGTQTQKTRYHGE